LKELWENGNENGFSFRVQLLQVFTDVLGKELNQPAPTPEVVADAKERLRQILQRTPVSELLGISFSELVQMTRCTPRHLSRIFHELVGMSFRDKQTEIRLARACELLATTESKVVDVALESGYQSLSLFNLMFKEHYGTSPSKWRQRHNCNKTKARQRRSAVLLSA